MYTYGDYAIFYTLPFAWCILYSIYTIIHEKFKPRAIELCKSEVLTFTVQEMHVEEKVLFNYR